MKDEEELAGELRADLDDDPEAADLDAVEAAADEPEERNESAAWLRIGAVFLLLGLGVTALLMGTNVLEYSKLVGEVMDDPNEFAGRNLTVEGELQLGSAEFDADPCEHRFVLEGGGHQMPVRYPRCVVPDTFNDTMEMDIVVRGALQTNGTFLAEEIIPRCPSKYEMRQSEQNGESMPHAMPTGES